MPWKIQFDQIERERDREVGKDGEEHVWSTQVESSLTKYNLIRWSERERNREVGIEGEDQSGSTRVKSSLGKKNLTICRERKVFLAMPLFSLA